jgi:hypothetical protein
MDARTFDHELGIRCGLNADWNCEAWQITEGPTNRTDGAVFVLDEETDGEEIYSIVRRWFLDSRTWPPGSFLTSPPESPWGGARRGYWEGRGLRWRDQARDPEAFDGHNDAIVVLAEGLSRSEMLAVVAFYRVAS